MKTKEKIRDFKRMLPEQLNQLLKEEREKLRSLGFDLAAGKVKNVREIRAKRRDIARIKTLLHQKAYAQKTT